MNRFLTYHYNLNIESMSKTRGFEKLNKDIEIFKKDLDELYKDTEIKYAVLGNVRREGYTEFILVSDIFNGDK